jgi:hypothetical protein
MERRGRSMGLQARDAIAGLESAGIAHNPSVLVRILSK